MAPHDAPPCYSGGYDTAKVVCKPTLRAPDVHHCPLRIGKRFQDWRVGRVVIKTNWQRWAQPLRPVALPRVIVPDPAAFRLYASSGLRKVSID